MIQQIEIKDMATFEGGPHALFALKPINYVFGPNGTGKTTISKAIAAGASDKCIITWAADPMDCFVYNRDFVEANFSQPDKFDGIFTLGKDEINLAAQIEEQRQECEGLLGDIARLKKSRDGDPNDEDFEGQAQKQAKLDELLVQECWKVKVKHDKHYKEVLRGNIKTKEKFKERAVQEIVNNKCTSVDANTLPKRVEIVFGPEQEKLSSIASPLFDTLIAHEQAAILSKKVVGKTDIDVAAIIEKLGNADWVNDGLGFLDKTQGKCPFCQQKVSATLKQELDAYFDATYMADTREIGTLKAGYASDAQIVLQKLAEIEQAGSANLDLEAFKRECKVLELLLKGNNEKLQRKQEEPSRVIALDAIGDATKAIVTRISAANEAIKEHNKLISEREAQRKLIEAEVWRLLMDDGITNAVNDHKQKKTGIDKAKKSLTDQIAEKDRLLNNSRQALDAMERKLTSVEPTVKDINAILKNVGFLGFSLAMTEDKKSYKLVRASGESAKHTLSEGEKTFITFLYFYHFLRGSKDGANVSSNRIVVFDDPVSSLDSDILHIVSSLIRELYAEVCAGDGMIKQLFILTHNIAFFKEVTFFKRRQKGVSTTKVTFWKVFKKDEKSSVMYFRSNPIKSFYDSLWADVRSRGYNSHNLPNTLRKILEHAAETIGGFEIENIEKSFSGIELTICRALMAWVNDGSHTCYDDIYMSEDGSGAETYLKVFKLIFERCGWRIHYDAMMQLVPEEEGAVEADAVEVPAK